MASFPETYIDPSFLSEPEFSSRHRALLNIFGGKAGHEVSGEVSKELNYLPMMKTPALQDSL